MQSYAYIFTKKSAEVYHPCGFQFKLFSDAPTTLYFILEFAIVPSFH